MMKFLQFLFSARQTIISAWRLLWDPNVPAGLKLLLPVFAAIYLISPIDLLPFLPFDDIVIVGLALRLFVELAQPRPVRDTVGQDYASDLDADSIPTTWRVVEDDEDDNEDHQSHVG